MLFGLNGFRIGFNVVSAVAIFLLALNVDSLAKADIISFSVAGWEAYDDIGADLRNTSQSFNIGAGSQITGVRWIGLTFESFGASTRSELVFGLSRPDAVDQTGFWDYNPAAGVNSPGIYGPLSGSFGAGLLGSGPFKVAADGILQVDAYALFDRNAGTTGTAGREALVSAGQLEVTYISAVPEPSSFVLIALIACVGGGTYLKRSRRRLLDKGVAS
jgi:hypothetical protein